MNIRSDLSSDEDPPTMKTGDGDMIGSDPWLGSPTALAFAQGSAAKSCVAALEVIRVESSMGPPWTSG